MTQVPGTVATVTITTPLDVTKTVYTVLDFIEWQRAGALDLRPYFQRGSVWTPKAKSYFIDTLLRGYPVPVIYLQNKTNARTLKNVRQVVDGQQRLRTILAYIDASILPDRNAGDNIKIMRSHNRELADTAFEDLPESLQARLTSTEFSVHVLPSTLEDSELLQIFARLNSTGERLNDQELRNAAYHGAFKALSYELAYAQIDRWREWGLFTPRALAQMREVEFTSELMMVLLRGISAKSKAAIDGVYREYDDDFPQSDLVSERFSACFDVLDQIFRQGGGRQVDLAELQTQSWVYALFAAVAGAAYGIIEESSDYLSSISRDLSVADWSNAARRVRANLVSRQIPDDLAKALRGASTDRSSRLARYEFVIGHL